MDNSGGGRVLIFSGVRGDTRRYRTLHLYEQLRLAGVSADLSHLTDPRLPGLVETASVVIMHRVAHDNFVEKLLTRMRSRNVLVILDADDFLYDSSIMRWIDSPDFQDPVRAALYRREIERHRATLDRCDLVMVSTNALAEMVLGLGKPVIVHRNAFNLEMAALSQQAAANRTRTINRVVVGYASGTRTHDRDFALIRPALSEVMARHPEVDLWLMGAVHAGDDWGLLAERVYTFPLVPWRSLPARLAMLDINLAPLVVESPFNQAKSEIKWMEAGLVGVPTVASPTDAFSTAIDHGRNGFLAESIDDWKLVLERLVIDAETRRSAGEQARLDVLNQYSPQVRGQTLIKAIDEWCGQMHKGPIKSSTQFEVDVQLDRKQSLSFSIEDESHPTYLELARYSLQHRGARVLLGQAWVFLRRKLAPIFPFRNGYGK